jgi:hypothetical protein
MREMIVALGMLAIGAGVAMACMAITDIRHSRTRRNKNAK